MLAVVLQWYYLVVVILPISYAFFALVKKVTGYQEKAPEHFFVAGMIILTVYAQFFSLFYKVGLLANILLLFFAVLLGVLFRKGILSQIKYWWMESSTAGKVAVACVFLLWAYFTSRGEWIYDTGLYHGQSIRWIEEYGIVKGLGNLHVRFGYNSSIFALYALLSMKWLTGGIPLHTVNGFFAFLLTLSLLRLGGVWKRKKMNLSDYARVAAIYYLTMICDEVISPSSDYAVMCLLFYIIIAWLALLEEKEKTEGLQSIVPYSLLCVLGVYTLTLKVTAGLILILSLKPAVRLLKEKQWTQIIFYLLLGIGIAAPWMIRSVLISGWLFYPLSAIDLFSVDWKIPKQVLDMDAAEIKTWGRALYSAALVDLPLKEWFPNWYRNILTRTEQLLIVTDLLALVFQLGYGTFVFVKRKWEKLDILLVFATIACSFVYWLLSAPLVRYGYTYVLLMTTLAGGVVLVGLSRKTLQRGVLVLVTLFFAYKGIRIAGYVKAYSVQPYYLWQRDYVTFELQEKDVNGQRIYVPMSGDQTGYYSFPSAPNVDHVGLRGESLQDGFLWSY